MHYVRIGLVTCFILSLFVFTSSTLFATGVDSVKNLGGSLGYSGIVYDKDNTSAGLYARFCDEDSPTVGDAKNLKTPVFPGKSKSICIDILNQLDKEVDVHVSFLDGGKDNQGLPFCETEGSMGKFGQYVTGYTSVYTIPATSYKRILPTIKMPVSAAGTVYGCISIYNETVFQEKKKQGGVTTLVRNALTMEVFVDTKVDVGLEVAPVTNVEGNNLVSDPMFITKQANGSYLVAVGFKNIGGLDENVEVQGTVTDVLKKVIELAPQTKTVAPEANNDIRYEIPALPWYKMWFTVDMTVTHNAVSEFRTEFITEKLLEKKTINVSKTFFVFPWWLVGALIVLLLIIHLIKRSRKHHHDEEKELEELKKWKAEHGTPPQA